MISKIKTIIKKNKKRIAYERCYKDQEKNDTGVFGICGKWVSPECLKCPYWIDISEVNR